ncbi:MAG: hypothetical protein P8Z33_14240, partial [Gammaproteobacteria bacterium]
MLTVRFGQLTVEGLSPSKIHSLVGCSPNEEPIEWFLLTTCDITDDEQARQCIRWYILRWRIEDWHR